MTKYLLVLVPVVGFVGFSFFNKGEKIMSYHADGIETINYGGNPPAEKTGAPGEGNCTECHVGDVMSAEGVVDFSLGGGPNYTPGSSYPMTISTLGGPKNGFELTVLDGDGNQAGTITAGANTSVITSGGRQYIRHNNSLGLETWFFNWEAPATDIGELTVYYAVNKADNNGSNAGDEIFLGNTTIGVFGASISENELEKGYKVTYNSLSKELNLNYKLVDNARVMLNVQDLSGRLIENYDFGYQNDGSYNEVLPVTKVTTKGVYVVSLFINNRVLNRKVLLD